MEIEDETNSYLKYLEDSESTDTYLLENNEVGLFSVEPIFTEIGATDWPQELPLLLTSSLITEDCPNNNNNNELNETCLISDDTQEIITNNEILVDNNVKETDVNNVEGIEQQTALEFAANETLENNLIEETDENPSTYILIEPEKEPDDETTQLYVEKNNEIPNQHQDSVLISSSNKAQKINEYFTSIMAQKCKICDHLCETLDQIKDHINNKHSEIFTENSTKGVSVLLPFKERNQINENNNKELIIYVCSECKSICTNKNDLKKHMIEAHALEIQKNERENETVQKNSVYLDDINIGLVKKQEKLLQQLKCSIKGCQATFPNEEYRQKHEKLHINGTKSAFNCSQCDKKFNMWMVARTHMHNEHGIDFGMIICPICNTFKNYKAVLVLRHMMIHSEVKPFLCSDCGKSFKQLAQLKNHEVTHKLPEMLPTWSKVKKCDKCDRFFANSKSLKTHIKTIHEKIKPFICNICGHKSSRKAMLDLHSRQHTASKPFQCDYCDFRTGDKNSLRKHVMKHTGTVAYQCPYCSYSCIQAGAIKSHFLHRHKDKPGVYFCKNCNFTTINESLLNSHQKLHESASKEIIIESRENNNQSTICRMNFELQADEEETQSCFFNTESQIEETVEDNGGITIPADIEMSSSV